RRGGAGAGDGRIGRRVSAAVSVQAYAGRMDQRCYRLAAVGAAHLLEALRANPPPQVEAQESRGRAAGLVVLRLARAMSFKRSRLPRVIHRRINDDYFLRVDRIAAL